MYADAARAAPFLLHGGRPKACRDRRKGIRE